MGVDFHYFPDSFSIDIAIGSRNLSIGSLVCDNFPVHPICLRPVYAKFKQFNALGGSEAIDFRLNPKCIQSASTGTSVYNQLDCSSQWL